MKKFLQTTVALATFAVISCTTPTEVAIATSAANLARIAASAAATYYGGPAAGALASAGLDALGTVLQGYLGDKIPKDVAVAAPGINGVGPALIPELNLQHTVTQGDVDKVNAAAAIAAAAKTAIVVPTTPAPKTGP